LQIEKLTKIMSAAFTRHSAVARAGVVLNYGKDQHKPLHPITAFVTGT
jgi:hypothetical protein